MKAFAPSYDLKQKELPSVQLIWNRSFQNKHLQGAKRIRLFERPYCLLWSSSPGLPPVPQIGPALSQPGIHKVCSLFLGLECFSAHPTGSFSFLKLKYPLAQRSSHTHQSKVVSQLVCLITVFLHSTCHIYTPNTSSNLEFQQVLDTPLYYMSQRERKGYGTLSILGCVLMSDILKYRGGHVYLRINEILYMCLYIDLCPPLVKSVTLEGKNHIYTVYPAGLATSSLSRTWYMLIE